MRVFGYENIPYVDEDTNSAMKSYHGTLMDVLKSGKVKWLGESELVNIQSRRRDANELLVSKLEKQHGFTTRKTTPIVCGGYIVGFHNYSLKKVACDCWRP